MHRDKCSRDATFPSRVEVPEWIQWSTKKKMFVGTHKKLGNVERQLLEVDDISLTKDHTSNQRKKLIYKYIESHFNY